MIETAVYDFLTASLPGVGVHYLGAKNSSSLPFVVFEITGSDTQPARGGKKMVYDDFEFNCYAATGLEAANVATQLYAALDGFAGDMGGENITLARQVNQFDNKEDQTDSNVRTVLYSINHTA